jgi:hypothetical protein
MLMHFNKTTRASIFLVLALAGAVCHAQSIMAGNQARNYDQLRQALMRGKQVRALFDFGNCQEASGPSAPNIQSGLPIDAFMIHDGQIAFSLTHPTLHGQQSDLITEFDRFEVHQNGEVDMSAYSWKPGALQATPMAKIICHIGRGAEFTW